MKAFLVQRWFLVALVLVLTIGIWQSKHLEPISNARWLRDGVVAAVMFCMSLPLAARSMLRSLRTPGPPLLALGVSFGILPVFAWAVSFLLRGDLAPGLQVAAVTPCTLASASVWTRRAGGNDAVSTLVTILTNSVCVFVTPLWLLIMTGTAPNSSQLTMGRMTGQLALLVVLPIIVAQLFRARSRVADWSTRHRNALSVTAQCGILVMVFLGAIRTGLNLGGEANRTTFADFVVMIVAVLVVHLSMFWLAVQLGKLFRFSREDQIAVGFSGSQKTLMVGLLMAMTLKASILPMVAYHCLQLFVDTIIADRYRAQIGTRSDSERNQAHDVQTS